MARLIDPSARERPVPRQITGRAQLRDTGPSGAIGRGAEILGASLERGADEIFRAQTIEEDRINTLRAEEAFTKLRERQLDLTVGEGTGFARLKGADAVTKPIFKEWGKRFEDAEAEITTSLSNDEQRTRFKSRAAVTRLQYQEEMLRHLAREGDVYAKEVYDGTIATESRAATARWDSPNDVASAMTRIRAAVDQRADRYGWAPDYRKAVIQEEHSKVHAAVVTQAIASGAYQYAQDWYNKNRADIDVATARQLARAVEDGTQKQLSAGYRNEFIAQRDSPTALTELAKRVSADPKLDLDRQNALLGPIASRIKTLETKAEIARERRLRLIERGVNQLNARTLAGYEPSFDEFAPYIAAAKGSELEAQVKQAIGLASATRSFRLSTPIQQEATLNDLEARARVNPASVDVKVLGALKTIHEAQGRLLKEAPVGFAYRQGLADPVRIDFGALEAQSEQLIARIGTARAMRDVYGTDLKPLLPDELGEIKARLDRAKTEDKLAFFGKLRAASGGDPTGYSAMMAQLAADEPALAMAGEYAAKDRRDAARLILDGQAILRPPRRTDGSPDQGKLWPMPPETDTRRRFQSLEGDAFSSNAKFRNMAYQATTAIYAKLSEVEGDSTGVLNTSRYQKAFTLSTGGVDTYRGRSIVLPYGLELGDFRRGLNARIDDIAATGSLAEGMTASQLRDMQVDAIGDGRYLFRAGNGFLVDKTGRPIVVNFNLEPEERERPARPMGRGAERQIPPWARPALPLERPE